MPLATITCPHCDAQKVSMKSLFLVQIEKRKATAGFMCPFCKKPIGAWVNGSDKERHSFISMSQRSELPFEDSDWFVDNIFPEVVALSAPSDTPPSIARIFVQAEDAHRRGHREAAGMSYRRTLELTVQDRGKTQGNLKARIEALGVTPELKAWAHTVRELGNESAHDPGEPTQEDLDDLAAFTRVFLEYTYTLPTRVARHIKPPNP